MTHTEAQLQQLQELLDASFDRASAHLTSIMTPGRRMTAEQLVAALPCPAVLNLATVTARGEPRISAVDGHFLDGQWHFGTDASSAKARQLRARPAVSASWTPRDGTGVFCHGTAVELDADGAARLDAHFTEVYGESPSTWGSSLYWARIEAHWLVGFAMPTGEQGDASAG